MYTKMTLERKIPHTALAPHHDLLRTLMLQSLNALQEDQGGLNHQTRVWDLFSILK